ncbi:MAG: electron transport complex subunit RsxG [[Actinobacillus] rossii]|uniref:Ion-translocating oxidoreductase complex subunit G n=1 Tax=[Actinobacillus] rossii TaxID=123820 RepID=A0A380TTF9_9PAST|nr:electron transport complex subunit RsxG [[Actinobacillus] rossii]MDY3124242.1 electron transport complex subunit RsxG [[Actinobacillus] rossii]SUT91722.1 electron transport complex protein RnfG [[Actinobacillus] rossii]
MNITKISAKYGALLGLVALLCTAISTGIYFLTKEKIDAEVAKQQQELLAQVLPQTYYDNDVITNCETPDSREIDKICAALLHGKISAYAIEATAPDGYSGNIRLLFGMTVDGEILGVRVLQHKETPGLGDKIETRISNWILSFNNKKITPDNLQDWAVKKDGGKFDQFAGATITPRAIVNQVKRSALEVLKNSESAVKN